MEVLRGLCVTYPDAYGLSVQRAVEKETGRKVSIGSVYTTLDRLEAKGLAASRWGEPTPERGGRRKRLYSLTAPGQLAMQCNADARRAKDFQGVLPQGAVA